MQQTFGNMTNCAVVSSYPIQYPYINPHVLFIWGFSIVTGVPQNGRSISWKIHLYIDDHRWLGSTPISGTPHIPLRNSWLVVSTPPKNMSSSVRMTIPNNNVLFVKIGLGRWLVYHLSSFTCCFLGVCYTPLFINQPMGIWDIYDSQFMEKSNLATKPPTYIGD